MRHPAPPHPLSSVDTPHLPPLAELLARLETDSGSGLSEGAAAERLRTVGPNRLIAEPPVAAWKKLLGQFNELVIWLLVAAALVSGAMGEWADSAAILAIVLVNGVIGFIQEERAERALAALQDMSAPTARVVRGGRPRVVPVAELVPGDLIELEAGDAVPADARLVSCVALRAQEAALTGESVPTGKDAGAVADAASPLGDRRNMVYAGTVLAAGRARGVVAATGMATELGRIAGMLHRPEREPTPLQHKLAELGRYLVAACVAIVVVIFALEMLRGGRIVEVLLTSVSLAVAAVPEGLPAVVTLTLALGLQRMARRQALIRKLPSVETLGSVTVVCSDKTGTLTKNEMTVREVLAGGSRYFVTGAGYAPRGEFQPQAGHGCEAAPPAAGPRDPDLRIALEVGARCNSARVQPRGAGAGQWEVIGDPTEGALLVAAMKAGIDYERDGGAVVSEIPFDSDRKMMSVLVRRADGTGVTYAKGAPEVLLQRCRSERIGGTERLLTPERRARLDEECAAWSARALRVLAVAYREAEPGAALPTEEGMVFAGLAGMIDPPREEAPAAVKTCRAAGIKPVMITGDHPRTAHAIAREIGIAGPGDRVVAGVELDRMTQGQLEETVEEIAVFARVSPAHKLRIVQAFRARGHVVAMTGDGVNDAPAVRAADIGIAMGTSGTDVTKEASAMVLTDDNFASIVAAVEEGRGIYDNIQKFVYYLLACNVGEVVFMFFAALVGWPIPLVAVQLLWINLVTDGLPALALAMEPVEPEAMARPARPPSEPVLTRERGRAILWGGLWIGLAPAMAFWLTYAGDGSTLAHARTVAFCVLAYSQLAFALTCRSRSRPVVELGFFTNPYLMGAVAISALLQLSVVEIEPAHRVLETTFHDLREWTIIGLLALAPAGIAEATKLVRRAGAATPAPDAPQPAEVSRRTEEHEAL